jgi:D-proline reductase (dithiol) PrdB
MTDSSQTRDREVDPWRFAGSFIAKVLGSAIPDTPAHPEIPWAPLRKPLSECKVSLVTTAGISMRDDEPFDMESEKKRPTWGDPSWRRLRSDATSDSIVANHLHIDATYIERDLNVALPLDRLRELAAEGRIGSVADSHYSIMGYQGNDRSELENVSAPAIARAMRAEAVDVALLAPV